MRRLSIAAVVFAFAVAAFVGERLIGRSDAASFSVRVTGRSVDVRAGTTLAEFAARIRLRPPAGDILDVNGEALKRGVVPGRFLVNGRPAALSLDLRAGDRVSVVPGHDRREQFVRRVERVPGGTPPDPQFSIAYVRGEEVVTRGALSHELVSARFRPLGAAKSPNAVALTFDDGPWPSSTSAILDELRRLHVHATFFVIGYLAQTYPALVRRELRAGMVIGNHSYNHPQVPPFGELPPQLLRDEISLNQEILARLGVHAHLFRPPGGSTSAKVVRAAAALGDRVVLWSVDPADWQPGISARTITQRVLASVRPGSIVILHDGGGDRTATLAALPAIVRGIKARGLRLVTLASRAPN